MNNKVHGAGEEQRGGVRSYVSKTATAIALFLFAPAFAGICTVKTPLLLREYFQHAMIPRPQPATAGRRMIPKDSRHSIINEHAAGRAGGINVETVFETSLRILRGGIYGEFIETVYKANAKNFSKIKIARSVNNENIQ